MGAGTTYYPGIGADAAIAELQQLVGEITSFWAQVEDGLFELFVVALLGKWHMDDIRPIRAVFFTFSSYEGKVRMVHNAIRTRFSEEQSTLEEWTALKKSMDGAARLRNDIAHLIPMAQSTKDKDAIANVRLVPPFWKGAIPEREFNAVGYSVSQLRYEMAAYWGLRPPFHSARTEAPTQALGYRLHQFTLGLNARVHIETKGSDEA